MRRRLSLLVLLLPTLASAASVPLPRELFLAGGALAVCSDLSTRACATPPDPAAEARRPARYRVDTDGIARAQDPALWTHPGAPAEALRARWWAEVREATGLAELEVAAMEAALDAACLAEACAANDAARPWSQLLDVERSAVLAAFEVPALGSEGRRPRERALPALSSEQGGVEVLRAFVAAAQARTAGRPRIAVVTASAFDPMDAVDFYRSLFRELGADAVWWPVDAASAAARFEKGDCGALPGLRVERLKLAQRERVAPDLASYQRDHCMSQPALMLQVQGVFFAGGDQWRHRQAFVKADGRPNDWLLELQQAHAEGRVVVGGTSAGAAVQSGAWMLGNGSAEAAVARAARVAVPPEPGCARAGRCGGVPEDALVLWPDGGLGLADGAIVDTHFSERARELRLLMAMQAADARWGYGADETSALRVREIGGRREIEAIGASGGWVFRRLPAMRDEVEAWYLAPGARLVVERAAAEADGERVSLQVAGSTGPAVRQRIALPADAFQPGALRAVAQRLAWRCGDGFTVPAAPGRAELRCAEGARGWQARGGLQGVGPLRLRFLRP